MLLQIHSLVISVTRGLGRGKHKGKVINATLMHVRAFNVCKSNKCLKEEDGMEGETLDSLGSLNLA